MSAIAIARLARWLGPWAPMSAAPAGIDRRVDGALRVWERPGRRPTGTVLLLAGLHPDGPDDARFDRFARVLAAAGARVVAPALADLTALLLTPAVFPEARAALARAVAMAGAPVAVMSISFASRVALHLAAERPGDVRRVVLFGGYRSWDETFRFALGAALPEAGAGRDPLNGPVVLGHMAEELLPEGERPAYLEAMRTFCRRTWTRAGDPPAARKDDGRHLRVGAELASALAATAPAAAWLLRIASRVDDGALAVAIEAAERARDRLAFLDPSADLARVRAPLVAIHGRDDDVIPWTHARALAAGAARGEALVTGLYGHTGAQAGGARATIGERAREIATMVSVLRALGRVVDGRGEPGRGGRTRTLDGRGVRG